MLLLLGVLAVLMFSHLAWAQDDDEAGGSTDAAAEGGQDPKKTEPPPNFEIDEVEEMDDDDFAELPLAD